jgi:hypothetical protein
MFQEPSLFLLLGQSITRDVSLHHIKCLPQTLVQNWLQSTAGCLTFWFQDTKPCLMWSYCNLLKIFISSQKQWLYISQAWYPAANILNNHKQDQAEGYLTLPTSPNWLATNYETSKQAGMCMMWTSDIWAIQFHDDVNRHGSQNFGLLAIQPLMWLLAW